VLVEPFESELLRFLALLVVDAVVFDAFGRDPLLDSRCSLVREDGVVSMIKQLFIPGDDEKPAKLVTPADLTRKDGRA
jgi:hypothetical protein